MEPVMRAHHACGVCVASESADPSLCATQNMEESSMSLYDLAQRALVKYTRLAQSNNGAWRRRGFFCQRLLFAQMVGPARPRAVTIFPNGKDCNGPCGRGSARRAEV